MKRLSFGLILTLLFLTSMTNFEENKQNDDFIELIENGNVSNETTKWGLYINPPAKGSITAENEEIHYNIINRGTEKWHMQGYYAGLSIKEGLTYFLNVDMASSVPRTAQIRIQRDSSPYNAYLVEDIQLTTEMQHFSFQFVMEEKSDDFAKLCFNIGQFDAETIELHKIRVDNLSLKEDKSTMLETKEMQEQPIIAINQLGYLPESIKEVRISSKAERFVIKSVTAEEELFSGKFTGPIDDPASGDLVYKGDFSALKERGEYVIEIPSLGRSYPFKIAESVYSDLYSAVEKVFYYQQCGIELSKEEAGHWAHKACHTQEAIIYNTDNKMDVTGGWHDAGDYGRYVSPGAKTVADLFIAADYNKDILKVTKYELDWLLKMQDAKSGGVYHKVTTRRFIGSVMPDKNFDELVLSPISATATGTFAAILAKSARLYSTIDPAFSKDALSAALNAWDWLERNPNIPGFTNPESILTGEYDDNEDGDERFWAAVELYLTTGEDQFLQYSKASYNKNKWYGLTWANVGSYGVISYIFDDSTFKDLEFKNQLTKDLLATVESISKKSEADGYGISLGIEYIWGSNEVVADNAMLLLLANRIKENSLYKDQAMTHLHYLLGANSLGQSYISGFGGKTILNPHHRPTNATGEVVPGMLAGGPNKGLQDPLAESKLAGRAPAKCFIDAEPSYSTNEMTIYWNSPLYAILSALQ